MKAFLSRLFRRPRADALAWIEVVELNAASRAATPLSWSMCVNLRNLTRPRVTCQVPSTYPWPICRSASANLLPGDNRSCWFARPIADPPRQRQSSLPPAYGMSPSLVANRRVAPARAAARIV